MEKDFFFFCHCDIKKGCPREVLCQRTEWMAAAETLEFRQRSHFFVKLATLIKNQLHRVCVPENFPKF